MKHTLLFLVVFLGGLFFVNAADMIILKDGNVIEAKIMEIHPTEIRYKRADNLNGSMIILPKDRVLSIKFEGGALEIVSASPPAGQQPAAQAPVAQTPAAPPAAQAPAAQTFLQTSLQNTLNTLPAITIAGNNLKFQFSGNNWTAMLNGENFSTGTIEVEDAGDSTILNLKQTHIWPGAVAGKVTGKLASKVPGGAVAGSALNATGALAGAVEASGPVMVLEYKAGPPAKLSYLRSAGVASGTPGVLSEPVPIVLSDGQWIQHTATQNESVRKDTTVQFSIANEEIGGQVREVLTMESNLPKGSGWRLCQLQLTNETTVQTLQKGTGVRFKVLGDGKKWKLILVTNETVKDSGHYEIPIVNKEGNLIEVDIPYSKLKQPTWGKKVRFIKSSINSLIFERHSDTGGAGPSTIKVFDMVIY